ncbi:unnamed protein product [Moneuplotes crassus]|uniref:Uncharacterized protein n=1 Tax=Euplotes crassus TaxID=5936 RepID=A0AAD1Y3A5_EUPCR|nr:unnamed protein product [Moneuplotes crassus]
MEKLIMKLERSVDQLNNEIDKQKKTNIKLKQEAKDKEDKMREQKEIMVKEFQEQLKNMSQEVDPKSIPLPPSLVAPAYISKQDIDGKCQGCEKDLLNVANFITKAKELVDPDHYNTFETRLDEIESHCNTEFGKCSDCKQISEEEASHQKELSIKASKISRECQTDAVHTEDYLFFQNMIEDYLQVCLRSKPYKAVKMDFKLKDSQKKELIMDLFKFKVAIKSKIQAFIDKYEAAHAIQEQIQEFSELVKEHEESKKKSKEADEQLEKEKKKIVEQLSKWANMNKEEPALQEKDTPQKEKLIDEMNPYTDLPSSPQSINSLNASDICNSSVYSDIKPKEITPSKILGRKDFQIKKAVKPNGQSKFTASGQKNRTSSSKTKYQIQKQKSIKTSKLISNLRTKVTPAKVARKFTCDLPISKESAQSFKLNREDLLINEYSRIAPTPDLMDDRDLSVTRQKYPTKLPALQLNSNNTIEKLPVMKESNLIHTPVKEKETDPEIVADQLENALDEELETSDVEDLEADEKMFEVMIQKHEELQKEIDQSLKKRVKAFYSQRDYNTYMLGDNREGKCGTGKVEDFTKNPTALKIKFEKIDCGYHHSAAISEDGIVYTWGRSSSGQLGQSIVINQNVPSLLAQPLEKVTIDEVSCGWQHTLAITVSKYLYSWGLNINGQLGLGDYEDRKIPTLVEAVITTPAMKISAGHSHSAMIDFDSRLYTWGANPDSRLCKKTTYYKLSMRPKNVNKPYKCKALDRCRIIDVSLGQDHSLFLDDKGVIYASGNPSKGKLGDPYYHPDKAENPYMAHYFLTGKKNRCVKVKAGDGFSVFLAANGQVYACGEGNYGRLGIEGSTSVQKPTMIPCFGTKGNKIIDIETGGRHTYAISKKKELYVWGFGFYHQLPNNSTDDCEEPLKIATKHQIEQVSCGYFHSAYILGEDLVLQDSEDSD